MRDFVFRWRGAIMAVMAAGILVLAHPTLASLKLGVAVAALGEIWRLWALGYSGEHTRSSEVNAPMLITAGPFAICRNPLYLGNTANALGVAIAAAGGWSYLVMVAIILGSLATLALVYGSCIAAEEKFLLDKFGEEYREYCARTPRLFPTLHPHALNKQGRFCWRNMSFEKMTLVWWVLIWGFFWWRAV